MFDRTQLHIHQSSPSYVSVKEQRAPTDESVKLLKEMEEAVQKRVDASVRLDTNTFKGVVFMNAPIYDPDPEYLLQFDLNGTRYKMTTKVPEYFDKNERVEKIIKDIGEFLAKEIFFDIFIKNQEVVRKLFK